MNFKITTIITILIASLLSSCVTPTPPARIYTLAGAVSSGPLGAQAAQKPLVIEVLPLKIPERLKRPQLVIGTRHSTQLKILEQDRWSSMFNDELQDAFTSGLSQQLNAVARARGARADTQSVYRIAITLQQYSAIPGDEVHTHFGWTITQLNDDSRENLALACQAAFSKTVGNGVDDVVKGIQAIVAEATQAIAVNVQSLNNGETGKCISN